MTRVTAVWALALSVALGATACGDGTGDAGGQGTGGGSGASGGFRDSEIDAATDEGGPAEDDAAAAEAPGDDGAPGDDAAPDHSIPSDGSAGEGGVDVAPGDAGLGDGAQETGGGVGICEMDIVLAVDTSNDMLGETLNLQNYLPLLLDPIHAAGIDLRVVLVAAYGDFLQSGVCLGGYFGNAAGCSHQPYDDSAPPAYVHDPGPLLSGNLLDPLPGTLPSWVGILRPGALRPVLAVSDTDYASTASAATVLANLASASPPGPWLLYAIAPAQLCPGALAAGTRWTSETAATGGEVFDLCLGVPASLKTLAARLVIQAGCVP